MANTGLTSTYVVALAINSPNGHLFARAYSIMGEAAVCFDQLITPIRGQNRITVLPHFDANAVTFNSVGHVFAAAAGPESLLITAGATHAPCAPMLDELSARRAISSKEVRITGTRDERESP